MAPLYLGQQTPAGSPDGSHTLTASQGTLDAIGRIDGRDATTLASKAGIPADGTILQIFKNLFLLKEL